MSMLLAGFLDFELRPHALGTRTLSLGEALRLRNLSGRVRAWRNLRNDTLVPARHLTPNHVFAGVNCVCGRARQSHTIHFARHATVLGTVRADASKIWTVKLQPHALGVGRSETSVLGYNTID